MKLHSERPWFLPAIIIVLALIAGACGDDDDGAGEPVTEEPTGADQEAAGAEPADDAGEPPAEEPTESDDEASDDSSTVDETPPAEDGGPTTGPADDSLEPVRIGIMNQEDDPIASFPDLRLGIEAAIDWINTERAGIGGHPIELEVCIQSSPEQALACAQDLAGRDLVSVINGLNVWTSGFDFYGTLGGTPVIGGLPLYDADYRAENARYFNGGNVSVFAGMTRFAIEELGAESIVVLKSFNPAADAAVASGITPIVDHFGVELIEVEIPFGSPDTAPQLAEVAQQDADATLVLTSDLECATIIPGAPTLGIDPATMIYSASCVTDEIIDLSGDALIGSWLHRGGPSTRDPWLGQDVLDELAVGEERLQLYAPDAPQSDFLALGFATMTDIELLFDEVGFENLSDAENIFAVTDDGMVRNGEVGFGWACTYADIGLPAVCSGDNFFVQVIDAEGTSAEPASLEPVNGLNLLREIQQG